MNNSSMPSPQEREVALFALAIEKPVAERAAFLLAVCGNDNALRQRLEELLAAHDQPEKLLEGAAGQPIVKATMKVDLPEEPADEAVGQMLGRYKLLERVGEGGCGVVYVAEQTEPVRRRVALKVIKLGMDTKQVVARFEAERQALAMMDHPNIAKVLDAGTTETGRPFFVMELVRGIRITEYCDQSNLSTKDRLDLFIKVCQAIQHAHQKGIIHRDIKPSNILVTLHDGVPVPKVIDFGIAKATEGRLTDATVYTQLHQFIGTPAYMSPEQAEMSGLDIDTRSDIYSLGVLLYELLAGSTPFDAKELMSQGIDVMRKTIREKEPVRPSTRLAGLQRDELTTTAKRRASDPPRLIHLLKGDLDWIVMKCLEKDRARRYETANGLAADIKHHLDNEPVLARPPSAAYRFQKAWRRNKLGYTAGVAVGVAIIAGAVVSYVQANRAQKAGALAVARLTEAEQARSEAELVSLFLQQVFESPDPERNGRTITVAETLDRAVKQLESDLADQPERRTRLQATLAKTYTSLGLHAPALQLSEQVHAYWVSAAGPDAPETLEAAGAFARSLWANGQARAALPMTQDLLARTRHRYGPDHTNTLSLALHYANVLDELGRTAEALKLREENLSAYRKVLGPEHRETLGAMSNLEVSYYKLGMFEKSRPLQEEVVALSRKVLGPEHAVTLQRLGNLGVDYSVAGRTAEAIQLLEEVLEKERRTFGPEHPLTIHTMQTLSGCYFDIGRRQEALQLREKVLELFRKTLGPEHPSTIWPMLILAQSLAEDGRGKEALELIQQALQLSRKVHGPEHWETLRCLDRLAILHSRAGRFQEAVRVGEEALAMARKSLGAEDVQTIRLMIHAAGYYSQAGQHDQAVQLKQEILNLRRRISGPEHEDTLNAMGALATTYTRQEHYDQALQIHEEIIGLRRKTKGEDHADVAGAIKAKADVHAARGEWADARGELLRLPEFKTLPDEAHFALMCLAALDVHLGEKESYESHRQLVLDRFKGSESAAIANRMAKAALLLPLQGEALNDALALAERAITLTNESPNLLHWRHTSVALARYRAGNWPGASKAAGKAVTLAKEAANPINTASASLVLAMARHRLSQVAEARHALSEGVSVIEQNWPAPTGGKLGDSWHDVLIAHILLREARALITP